MTQDDMNAFLILRATSEPTPFLKCLTSCIDLMFTNEPNLIVDSGVHPSIHQNCHHQVNHCKLNVNIDLPPSYDCHVWDYNTAEIEKSIP